MHSDRNLLVGILALQMDFVSRDQLVGAMNAWVLDKARPIEQLLIDQRALAPEEERLLAALVERHLAKHQQDVQASLAALSSIEGVLHTIRQVPDPELHATLLRATTARPVAEDGSPPETTPDAPRYRVLRSHAKGGLGEVFIAEDAELRREVALKEIHARYRDDPESRARFLLEAEVTGGLEHPGIVPVYGMGCYADGRPFYAMRFIKGDSLKEAVQRFYQEELRLPSGERLVAFRQLLTRFASVCQTVAYAHSRGVVHRDLKPENILLGRFGETLVVDWGLAKRVGPGPGAPVGASGTVEVPQAASDGVRSTVLSTPLPTPCPSSDLTQAGQVLGTPAYMSPEQAEGELERVGPPTDIYALGAILYELLTGRPPYRGTAVEVLERLRQGPPLPPSRLRRNVPRALEAICLKAMARAPGERYATASDLTQDLDRWTADEPVTAYREPLALKAQRWTRKHRTAAVSGAVAALLLVASLWGGWSLWKTAEQDRRSDLHHFAEAQEQLGVGDLQAGRFDSAAKIFRQAVERLDGEPALAELRDRLGDRLDRARRLLEAERLSARAEERLIRMMDNEAITAFEASLAQLRVLDHADWWKRLPQELTAAQQERLLRDIHIRLLILGGLKARKGLMNFGDATAARAGFQAALPIIEAAQRYQRTYMGDFIELYCRAGLGRAGEAGLQADTVPLNATDYYFLGVIHVWIDMFPQDAITRFTLSLVRGLDSKTPLATAERHLRAAASLDPGYYWTYWWLSVALMRAKNFEAAELAAGTCIGLRPDLLHGYDFRARAILHQIRPDLDQRRRDQLVARALADLDAAVRVVPEDWQSHLARAEGYAELGDYAKAILDCSEAIRCGPQPGGDPHFCFCYRLRGEGYLRSGRVDESIADYTEAIRLFPTQIEAYAAGRRSLYQERGAAYYRNGDYRRAIADYTEALRIHEDAKSFEGRGVAHLETGDFRRAAADLNRAFGLDAEHFRAYRSRGEARAALGEWAPAEADLRKAVDRDKRDSRAWFYLAYLLLRRDDAAGYRRFCEDVFAHFSEDGTPEAALDLAWVCALAPGAAESRGVVGLAEKGAKHRAGSSTATRGRRLPPDDDSYIHRVQGAARFRAGEYEAALKHLRAAHECAAHSRHPAPTWLLLAMTHQRLGHAEEARAWLSKARQWIDPGNSDAAKPLSALPWFSRLELEFLLAEAERTVAQAPR